MSSRLSERLTITVISSPSDDHDQIDLTISSEMIDCNVHAWFDLFNKVLAAAGFDEQVIMQGACQLAFNETRPMDMMRKVAGLYDLTLSEDGRDTPHLVPVGDN